MTAPARPTTQKSPASGTRPAPAAVQTRLPWWGALLPALGFALLLVLLIGQGHAEAAQRAADAPAVSFFRHLWDALGA
ncbi:hypothetical protein FM076_06765 [Streptomyces albus subsp. chlorinus]|nr:hypothetical protein [Streptomyces albus]NSC20927.1 hypothetical protein [Streptomyces albus subsp. chlorinus]